MPQFLLTKDAEQDLRDVASYTLNTWGKEVLEQYRSGLGRKETPIIIGVTHQKRDIVNRLSERLS
ncbi:MAG: type II toxin-antitoxin system RelE/ParE family toxin [Pseudomonadales bacterium]|nr:type II toxin-antitoxin system RelE/ParE family toxin [Pseudomonadales bacterium]